MSRKFVNKKIWDIHSYNSIWKSKNPNQKKNLINIFITILCVLLIWYFGKYIIQAGQTIAEYIWKSTINIVSKRLWEEMIEDQFGNVNIMFLWYWGWDHHGWFLSDSIIVASWNKKLWAVSMISVPRDLYVVNKETRVHGRINEIFSRWVGRKHEFDTWAQAMIWQLENIFDLKIPYYMIVDFEWFTNVIDTLGGIEVNVEKPIRDTKFPDDHLWYETFEISSWLQILDWETALKYARSRYSTSDFDRSLRQQQIINAVAEKALSMWLKPSTIKQLYSDYVQMVETNVQMDEMIGLVQYIPKLKHMFSYWLTTDCSNVAHRFSYPGCFLYAPDQANFGWAAVMLPVWSDKNNPSNYDYIHNFAFYVMHNQKYLIENPQITIRNWIDKQYARQQKVKVDWHANQVAVKLKKYAFNVPITVNAPTPYLETELYILSTWNYDETIHMLQSFLAIDKVIDLNDFSIEDPFLWPDEIFQEQMSWTELLLILWNTYIDRVKGKTFNYYK